jgi:hypothetical protein
MTRLETDIALLTRAADAAGLVIFPGGGNGSFPDNVSVTPATLKAMAEQLDAERGRSVEYRLIDVEAVWLLQVAQQLSMHRHDGNAIKVERLTKLGTELRSMVELDLVNARKSIGLAS